LSDSGISIGDAAPGFSLPDTEGRTHEFGGPGDAAATVVYWTCNHCPYALAWHERLLDAARDYGERGVRFIAVNSNDAERYPRDSLEAMRQRVEAEGGWPHPYLHDESQEVARAYGARTTPDIFVFDDGRTLRYRGAPDEDYEDPSQGAAWLREALDAILEGREVERPETEPVGCGVKWK
jgi:peroxiredoxin